MCIGRCHVQSSQRASQEPSVATPVPASAAEVESDVPSLIWDEGIALVLKLPGDGRVYRQAPYTISTSGEQSAATSVSAPAAGAESDAPSLIEDEDYYLTPIVESKAWDSFSEHHSQLWKLGAPLIEKVPDDDDLDTEGKDKDGRKAPLVLTVQ